MKVLHININYIHSALHQAMIEKLDQVDVHNQVFVPKSSKTSGKVKPNLNVKVVNCFNYIDRFFYF
ncbi:hypothetical protein OAO42_01795, partial [Candidatus Izimaplasma bacterium]|nr:hypothetical protein [Candidatus Izimaplasma bacterium]